MDTITDTATTWTKEARETWREMALHVAKLTEYYGPDSKESREASASFVRIAESIVGWGDVKVCRDGALSLICFTSSITFGIVWFGHKRRCTNEGCNAYLNPDGHAWWMGMSDDRKDCGDHTPDVALDAPLAGTWSFHS